MRAAIVNGEPIVDSSHAIAIGDRGLNYGDGLFETMLLKDAAIRFMPQHLARLSSSCSRLGMLYPGDALLEAELGAIVKGHRDGVIKIVMTRGVGGRGYRPDAQSAPTRIVALYDTPDANGMDIAVRWCEMRLARNPALAGMKHLNRLEQVLAQCEWSDGQIAEGFMLDYEGELVCGTSSNVFLVRGQELVTPDLRYCGVRGVMRGEVIRLATQLGISVHDEPLWPDDVASASEVFVTNAVRGIRAVVSLDSLTWSRGAVTQALCEALNTHA
jgi:4-amino-4-deoxychorismate lyase